MNRLLSMSLSLGLASCVSADHETLAVEQELGSPERVVRSARGGKVDLDLQFTEFFGSAFTLSTWFQPEFIRAHPGPILSASMGGRFSIGMGEYSHDTSMLQLQVGGKTANYRVPNLQRREWYHLAVVRSALGTGGAYSFSVYLDGLKLTPMRFDTVGGGPCLPSSPCIPEQTVIVNMPEISFSTASPMTQVPTGRVRIGRLDDAQGPDHYWQFYGLVDEVAAYTGVMSPITLAAERRVIETATLIKGFTFDELIQTNPKLAHATTFTAPTVRAPIDGLIGSIFDSSTYASPTEVDYQLPFARGTAWKVIQEFDDTNTHNGTAAFCLDLSRVGAVTYGTPVYSAADGEVTYIHDSTDDEGYVLPDDWKNLPWKMWVRTAPNEMTTHMHLRADSVEGALCPGGDCIPMPSETANEIQVVAGQQVGVIGVSHDPDNSHLHFAVRSLRGAETSTIPYTFSDYDTCEHAPGTSITTASDLATKCTWRRVVRGTPKKGEIVRRP